MAQAVARLEAAAPSIEAALVRAGQFVARAVVTGLAVVGIMEMADGEEGEQTGEPLFEDPAIGQLDQVEKDLDTVSEKIEPGKGKRKSDQRDYPGNAEDLKGEYDKVKAPEKVYQTPKGETRVKTLSDGSSIGFRGHSSGDKATLDIKRPGGGLPKKYRAE